MATKLVLPELPYAYDALEPVISEEIMRLHHTKHHQAYVNGYNAAVDKIDECISRNDVRGASEARRVALFNEGGHFNHSLFWNILAPKSQGGGVMPSGDLAKAIDQQFGSLTKLIEQFNTETAAIQGSGWGWLAIDKETKGLTITTSANQDILLPARLFPLLGIDVWEHAYYLQYKNVRAAYLKAIWEVINWKQVELRYTQVISGQ
jgi:Fe-Mn family superoxide dismutase